MAVVDYFKTCEIVSVSNWEETKYIYEQKEDLKPFSVMVIIVITSSVLVSPFCGARVELLSTRVVFCGVF